MQYKLFLIALAISLVVNIVLLFTIFVHASRVERKKSKIKRIAATIIYSSTDEREKPSFATSTFRAIATIYDILNS